MAAASVIAETPTTTPHKRLGIDCHHGAIAVRRETFIWRQTPLADAIVATHHVA
jgi:hypothetical protein